MWRHGVVAKRPRDPVQLAKQVFDIAIGEAEATVSESKRPGAGRNSDSPSRRNLLRCLALGNVVSKVHHHLDAGHEALRITPNMAAGLSDHVWSLEEIAAMADSYMPQYSKPSLQKEKYNRLKWS
jgi:hypothetical protein